MYSPPLDLTNVWQIVKGEGIRVAVIDDGFMLSHEDLIQANWLLHVDVSSGETLTDKPIIGRGSHGTRVAGLIFAQHNDIGVNGIAPHAQGIAIQLNSGWTSELVAAFAVAKLAKADVINCSWSVPILMQPVSDIIQDITNNGRNGKGSVVVFAAGNKINRLSRQDIAAINSVLTVTAYGQDQQLRGAYGEPVDIAVPEGWLTTLAANKSGERYAKLMATSGTAPIVSGFVALMLSINPELTVQQVKQILINASEPISAKAEPLKSVRLLNIENLVDVIRN